MILKTKELPLDFMNVLRSILLILFIFNTPIHGQKGSFDESKTEVVLRMVGHRLLLANHDSTSRVLPIKKLSENHFQLKFSSQLAIHPDTLVALVQNQLSENNISHAYIVNVKECLIGGIVYSYAILGTEQKDIVPCRGRLIPENCYFIEIKFESEKSSESTSNWYLFLLGGLLFVLLIIYATRKKNRIPKDKVQIRIGEFMFDFESQVLLLKDKKIDLTNKEAKILNIFAHAQNEIIDRERIQKEVWEDEGIIVGRSLDMYISKLRKKLSADGSITLANEHGRGYKLTQKK